MDDHPTTLNGHPMFSEGHEQAYQRTTCLATLVPLIATSFVVVCIRCFAEGRARGFLACYEKLLCQSLAWLCCMFIFPNLLAEFIDKGLGTHAVSPDGAKAQYEFLHTLIAWSGLWAVMSWVVQILILRAIFHAYDKSSGSPFGMFCYVLSCGWMLSHLTAVVAYGNSALFPVPSEASVPSTRLISYQISLILKTVIYGLVSLVPLFHLRKRWTDPHWVPFHIGLMFWIGSVILSQVSLKTSVEWPHMDDLTFSSYQFIIWTVADLYLNMIAAVLIPMQALRTPSPSRPEKENGDPEKAITRSDRTSEDTYVAPSWPLQDSPPPLVPYSQLEQRQQESAVQEPRPAKLAVSGDGVVSHWDWPQQQPHSHDDQSQDYDPLVTRFFQDKFPFQSQWPGATPHQEEPIPYPGEIHYLTAPHRL
ncbi:hypothetical protein G7054_g13691 [Neopestalotiopsis clavispora]|nr:hypothetical protein G7054_g13691 [Neopestalotiopsis clavispora]